MHSLKNYMENPNWQKKKTTDQQEKKKQYKHWWSPLWGEVQLVNSNRRITTPSLWKRTPLENRWNLCKALVHFVVLGLPFMEGHCWHHVSKSSLVVPESKHKSKGHILHHSKQFCFKTTLNPHIFITREKNDLNEVPACKVRGMLPLGAIRVLCLVSNMGHQV